MSDYNRISRTLLQPVTTTLGGVVIGAATVLLVQRWLAARARGKADPVVEGETVVVEDAPPARPVRATVARKRAKRA